MTTDTRDHYHVFCGFFETDGPSEFPSLDKPDNFTFIDAWGEWTLTEAKDVADEWIHDNPAKPWDSAWDGGIAVVWVVACDQPCRLKEIMEQPLTEWGEPYASADVSGTK